MTTWAGGLSARWFRPVGVAVALGALLTCSPAVVPVSGVVQGPEAFVACHPPAADLSSDGGRFISVGPSCAVLRILDRREGQPVQRRIPLPAVPTDAVMLDGRRAVVSFESLGGLAIVDLDTGEVGELSLLGRAPGRLCRAAQGGVLVADAAEKSVYWYEPSWRTTRKTFHLAIAPIDLGWRVPDAQLDAVNRDGALATILLSEQ